MSEQVIAVKEAVEKIRQTKTSDALQRAYFNLLADRLAKNPEVVPMGVAMALILLGHDLVRNRDGFTGGPMPAKLRGVPPTMYTLLTKLAVSRMGEFFPEGFAKQVKAEWDAAVGLK